MRRIAVTSLLLTASACQSPSQPEPMDLTEAWDQGYSTFQAALGSLPKEDQWLAVRNLLQDRPSASDRLSCEVLPDEAHEACEPYLARIRERPHLWGEAHLRFHTDQERSRVEGAPRSPESGPPRTRITLENHPTPRLLLLPPMEVPCESRDAQCRIQEAKSALYDNKLEHAAQICLGTETAWRGECFFRLGEYQARRTSTNLEEGLSWAVDYCLASKEYAEECLDQVLITYWLTAPSASHGDPAHWGMLLKQSEIFKESTRTASTEWRGLLINKFWAGLMHHSYQQSTTISALNAEVQFPQLGAHIRSAAAFRWVQLKKRETLDWGDQLSDLETSAKQLLNDLARPPTDSHEAVRFTKIDYLDHWQEDARGDSAYPATSYLGASRRTWSEDPLMDAQIALLESFARHRVAGDLLMAASDHPSEQVAWTAQRLRDAARFP